MQLDNFLKCQSFSGPKNSWNQMNQFHGFFFFYIFHFLRIKCYIFMENIQKIFSWNWFIWFHNFFGKIKCFAKNWKIIEFLAKLFVLAKIQTKRNENTWMASAFWFIWWLIGSSENCLIWTKNSFMSVLWWESKSRCPKTVVESFESWFEGMNGFAKIVTYRRKKSTEWCRILLW